MAPPLPPPMTAAADDHRGNGVQLEAASDAGLGDSQP